MKLYPNTASATNEVKKDTGKLVWVGIGINFMPADVGYKEFVDINRLLTDKYGSTFSFDPTVNQPHLNLYDVDIPATNLADVEVAIQQIAENTTPFDIELSGIKSFEFGSIYVACRQSEQLARLEEEIVTRNTGFRDGCRTKDYWQPWRKLTEEQKENREKYGNPFVLTTFLSHISVGFVKKDERGLSKIVGELGSSFKLDGFTCDRLDLVIHSEKDALIGQERYKFNAGRSLWV